MTLQRDLRATLRGFLTLSHGLTYADCVEISEDFTQFLIDNTDDNLLLTNGTIYQTFQKVAESDFSKEDRS